MTDALDPSRLTINERNDLMATAKSRVADLEARREHLAHAGRALGADRRRFLRGLRHEARECSRASGQASRRRSRT